MNDRIASVERAVANARGKWSGLDVKLAGLIPGGQDPGQILGAIDNMEHGRFGAPGAVDAWKARGRGLVQVPASATRAAVDAWVTQGNELLRDLQSIADYSHDAQLSTIVLDTAAASAKEVADDVGGLLLFWGKYGKTLIVLAVVGLGAFYAFKVYRSATGAA